MILVSLTSFSQTVTLKTDSVVILNKPIAINVVKDLIAYDGLKLELKTTQELLSNVESKSKIQDNIIEQYKIKDNQYKEIISNYNVQILAYENLTNNLKKDLKKSKIKGFYHKFGLTLALGAITYLYITK